MQHISHTDIWRRGVIRTGRRGKKCKGPEAGTQLLCGGKTEKANEVGVWETLDGGGFESRMP